MNLIWIGTISPQSSRCVMLAIGLHWTSEVWSMAQKQKLLLTLPPCQTCTIYC